MDFSKFPLNSSEQAYQFGENFTEEHDTTAQTLARAEALSAPDEGEAEGSVVLVGNGGGIGVCVSAIKAIAINGQTVLNRLPADN